MSEVEQLKAEIVALKAELERTRDIKEREAAHGDLLSVRMRQLLDLLPAGVVLIDNQGKVSECNPAAEDLLGTPLNGESWMQIIQRSFAPKSDDGHEISLRDGRRVSILTRAMRDEPGQLLLLTDQTETRLLQSRLSQYQRLSEMGRMMASLAHQIRTPLAAALLYTSHLSSQDLTAEQRITFAQKVKSRLTHLERQVQDMLIFARGETTLDELLRTDDLLRYIDDLLDVPLAQYDADCDLNNEAPDVLLQCNREALLGAILNLVNNALQAAGNIEPLKISLQKAANELVIEVADRGPGMDHETLQKVMQPFFTTKSHGTGLGLAVAQVVAKAHHGRFEISSVSGQGTSARLYLPIIERT